MTITALSAVTVPRWFISGRTGRDCDGYDPKKTLAPPGMIPARRRGDVAHGVGRLLEF